MWFLTDEVRRQLEQARAAKFAPTAEQRTEFLAAMSPIEADGVPRNLRVAGDVAEIRVDGVLTPRPDWYAFFFGGGNTTYEQIQSALAIADADPNVRRAILLVSSYGGHVEGLFETLAAIEQFSKSMSVRTSCACSAAYAIAAVAGKIQASTAATSIGSVGIVASYLVQEDVIQITSTEAPDKRPDVTTEEGRAKVREHLDALHGLMVDAIAKGRSKSVKDVNAEFGRGAVLTAGDAKKRGMIDTVARPALRAVVPRAEADNDDATAEQPGGAQDKPKSEKPMDIKTLEKEHPEVFAQAVEAGATKERDRVCAHLTMGKTSGDLNTAYEAIESGAEMTQTLQAKYMSAGMSKANKQAKQTDSDDAGKALDDAPVGSEPDLGDAVVASLKKGQVA